LEARGDLDQAEAQFRAAFDLATEPAEQAAIANNLGLLLESESKATDAEAMFARAAALFEKAYGQRHPEFATALTNLAGSVQARGDAATAASLFVKAIQVFADTTGVEHAHAQAACRALLSMDAPESTQSAARGLCRGTRSPGPAKTPIQ
jgi:Flp pilus assembly protein TadD